MAPEQPSWKIKCGEHVFTVNEKQLDDTAIEQIHSGTFHCIKDNRSVTAVIDKEHSDHKQIRLVIEGEIFELEIKDQLDQMLDEMGFSKALSRQIKEIKAPMPGMVLDITVAEGQAVKEGDKLLILGAMKMENSITIAADAVIKKINITSGQAVEKGQVLIELE